jgi:hypothetical protein
MKNTQDDLFDHLGKTGEPERWTLYKARRGLRHEGRR